MDKSDISTGTDPEVFRSIGIFETSDATKNSLSIRLQFAKFAHGFKIDDFQPFVESIGPENITGLGRLSFPNEWQMTVTTSEVREKLIRLGRTRINHRSCWIHPLNNAEVRGFIHWLPNEVPHMSLCHILRNFGEVLFVETQHYTKFPHKIACDARYFSVYLKPGTSKEDIPHFVVISGKLCLITIRGRAPACFHCRQIGHKKSDCKKYREKLGEYCLRKPEISVKREKRGKRHKRARPRKAKAGQKKTDSKSTDIDDTPADLEKNSESAEKMPLEESSVQTIDAEITSNPEAPKRKAKRKKRRKKKNLNDVQNALENNSTVVSKGNLCLQPADSGVHEQVHCVKIDDEEHALEIELTNVNSFYGEEQKDQDILKNSSTEENCIISEISKETPLEENGVISNDKNSSEKATSSENSDLSITTCIIAADSETSNLVMINERMPLNEAKQFPLEQEEKENVITLESEKHVERETSIEITFKGTNVEAEKNCSESMLTEMEKVGEKSNVEIIAEEKNDIKTEKNITISKTQKCDETILEEKEHVEVENKKEHLLATPEKMQNHFSTEDKESSIDMEKISLGFKSPKGKESSTNAENSPKGFISPKGRESSTDTENSPQGVKPQINEIVRTFMLQLTDALCEAGVTDLNYIRHKLHMFGDMLQLPAKKGVLNELQDNLREEHDIKASTDISSPDLPKLGKKKKKKRKNIAEV